MPFSYSFVHTIYQRKVESSNARQQVVSFLGGLRGIVAPLLHPLHSFTESKEVTFGMHNLIYFGKVMLIKIAR